MAAVTGLVTTSDTSNVTSYTSGAFTPAASDLLVVFVTASNTVAAGTMTGSGGMTFTLILSALNISDTIYAFASDSGASASSQTVTFDCTGDAATGANILVAGVSGMSYYGSTSTRQSGSGTGTAGTTPSATFPAACLTGNPTLCAAGNTTNPAGITPPSSWSSLADTGYATPTRGLQASNRDSGFTGSSITWGSTSTAHGELVIELDASAPVATNSNGFLAFFI